MNICVSGDPTPNGVLSRNNIINYFFFEICFAGLYSMTPIDAAPQRQAEGAQTESKRASKTRLILCIRLVPCRARIFSKIPGSVRKHVVLGTVHLYKRNRDGSTITLDKLSDKFRKFYGTQFHSLIMTEERCEDGMRHFHFALWLHRLEDIREYKVPNIRNVRIWHQEFDFKGMVFRGENLELYDEDNGYYLDANTTYSVFDPRYGYMDPGYKARFYKYGILKYVMYITKYFHPIRCLCIIDGKYVRLSTLISEV